ncbi:MAG: UvrD-helicase domain-containing protein, partial [Candidatus Marinimicrobia bacterium]|nr:UvrD-helicase domain-containing protein [Candidatus Neomarinimicrobiota bacterium]
MDHLKRALNCDRSVFIQACAGAGKTFALTKRYAAILDRFAQEAEKGCKIGEIDPKKILVITFTKKAAAEMKERIYKDMSVLLSGKEIDAMKDQNINFGTTLRKKGNEGLNNYKKHLKERFSQNAISTIDSFCAGILREFAYKLGLDPQFLSQDDHDTKRLLNENLDAWISKKLSEDAQSFNVLLEEFSFLQIKEILKSMYASREILDEYINEFESKSDNEIWRDWLIRYTAKVDVETLFTRFMSLWQDAQNTCKNKTDKLYLLLKEINENISLLDRTGDPLEFRVVFLAVLKSSLLFKVDREYRVSMPGNKGNWKEGKDLAEEWFDLLKKTEALDIQQSPGPQDKKIIPLLKILIAQFKEFNEYYLNIRIDRDLLDFSDVIILTHKLLSEHKDVRTILGQRYRHIMLDEFQDTNPLRWEIIKIILDAGKDIKLFIVGDRKQSIYRFNNADVTVMNTAEKLVEKLGGDPVIFNDNYRSSKEFIEEGINPFMSMIMKKTGEDKEDYEADFESTNSPINKKGISPAIERIWCETEKDEEDYIPAYHAAWQVKRLLAEHENTEIDPGDAKPLIAILLRRYTKISDYLQAFNKLGIPVSILGGKNFYSSPALMDIFYFISVLDNPRDDHALIGLLRSPFFALPDPIIHLLSKREKISAFDAMGAIPELQNAYRDILSWKEASKTQSIDELIASIIDENDRELGYVSELMAEQQLANFDKALNIIRGQQRNGATLRVIREFLHYQIKTEAQEAQANYPATARVHILTVHKAKGLEYPIVIIPEMNQKGSSDKNKFRYGRYDNHPEISLSLSDDEKPGLLLRLKEITKEEEEAEDKRVFYVALTRAI